MIGGINLAFMQSLSCRDLLKLAGNRRLTPVISALGKWRQEHQLTGTLGYTVKTEVILAYMKPYLKTNNHKEESKRSKNVLEVLKQKDCCLI